MFIKMILGVLFRQKKKLCLIVLTIGLGISLATSMLNIMFDVSDKVNQELKAYGANLIIVPKGISFVNEKYQLQEVLEKSEQFIEEKDLTKIKMIFWTYNIIDFSPYLDLDAQLNNEKIKMVGTWFNNKLKIPTGDEINTGMLAMKSWWTIEGNIMEDNILDGAMVGTSLASKFNLKIGDSFIINVSNTNKSKQFIVHSIFSSGGIEDQQVYVSLQTAQKLSNKQGMVERVEVSALTTPENELARRAAKDPESLSMSERDTWYCTAYISSIAYQLEEIMQNIRVKTVMQVAKSEGLVLNKTEFLMLLLTILSLVCSALAISNIVTANVIERSKEFGLLKALGATNLALACLVIFELFILGLIGATLGYVVGIGFSQIIGYTVFDSVIQIKIITIPISMLMVIFVIFLGCLPALRLMFFLSPKNVLHGR